MSDVVNQFQLSSGDFDAEGMVVRRFRGREAVNELSTTEVEVVQDEGVEDLPRADAVLGAGVQLTVLSEEGTVARRIHGIVSWARYRGAGADEPPALELRIVPRAWRLTLFRTQELFLDQSIPDVIRAKLERVELGHTASWNLLREYPPREVVMQYQESDWDFVCRLCEHYGITFFFEQREDGEHLVFTDHNEGWSAETSPLPYQVDSHGPGVTAMSSEAQGTPSVFIVNDYNYRHPQFDLTGVASLDEGLAGGVVEYGAHHRTAEEAATMATLRMEEAACRRIVHRGESNVVGVAAGTVIQIEDHIEYEGRTLRVVSVVHEAAAEPGVGAEATTEGAAIRYTNRFVCCPGDVAFRPARVTPRPKITGIVSGVVQPGPEGELGGRPRIDDDGRYLVQFHFDGTDHGPLPASQAMRMAQPFVGEGANGMHFPLQRGTEVLIAFIDGNPDRPIIVGAVPNATNPATVVARESDLSRIQTARGISIAFGRKY